MRREKVLLRQFHHREIIGFLKKFRSRQKHFFRRKMFDVGSQFFKRFRSFLKHFGKLILCCQGVLKKQHRIGMNVIQETFAVFLQKLVFYIWDNRDFFVGFDRKLRFHVKRSDAVDFIAKKFNAVRIFIRERKHVDNSTAHRKFARLRDKIHTFKVVFKQNFVHEINRHLVVHGNFQRVFVQLFAGYDFFKQRIGIGNDDNRFFASV